MSDAPVNHTPHTSPTELPPVLSVVVSKNGAQTWASSVQGRRKTFIYEPRCGVCTADEGVLADIHRLSANGTPIARIGRMVGVDAGLTNRQIRHHLVTHVSEYALFERALASAAFAFGEGDAPARVSGLHASQIILERGTKLLTEGRVEIKASDLLAAARFQHEIEQEGKDVADASMYSEVMGIIMRQFYQAIGPSRFNSVMASIASDPRMAEIMRDTGLSPASAIEAEDQDSPLRTLISSF